MKFLLSLLTGSVFAATITVNPGDAVQTKINTANSGDTVTFANGSYSGSLTLKSGVTYKSVNPRMATITGTVTLPNGSKDITIQDLTLRSSVTNVNLGSNSNNAHLTGNDMSFGGNSQGYAFQGMGTTGLIVDHNYIHDSLGAARDFDLSGDTTNFLFSYNRRHMISYGGHIDHGNMNNVKLVSNYTTAMHNMGFEIQDEGFDSSKPETGLVVQYNVFTDWYQPWNWSFGMSIPPQRMTNSNISFNYLSVFAPGKTAPTWGWGVPWSDGSFHASYGIEYGLCGEPWGATSSCIAEGNITVGPWTGAIICAEKDSPYKNNHQYGRNSTINGWYGGPYYGEGGLHGGGNCKDLGGNTYDQTLANAPMPGSFPWAVDTMKNAGPGGGSTTPPPPPPPVSVAVSALVTDSVTKISKGHFVIVGPSTTKNYSLAFSTPADSLGSVSSSSGAIDVYMPSYGWDVSVIASADGVLSSPVKFLTPKINGASAPWPIPTPGAYNVSLAPISTVPTAPTGLVGKTISPAAISLTWVDASSNETGFEVERKLVSETVFVKVASLPINSATYLDLDPTVDVRKNYNYRVRAIGASGPSGYSNMAAVLFGVCP